MLPQSICFVDIETTGTSAYYNRVIEIGILKVVDGKIVKKYQTLINPQTHLDPFIEKLTGITIGNLENAPLFENIAEEIYEILSDSIFVAHNVRFDYGFLRNEYRRLEKKFRLKHFCTVKLARVLYPNLKRHNLDSIIENFNIKIKNRHRAYDDAKVLFEFYQKSQKLIERETFEKAVDIALKRPSIPLNISQEALDNLPELPGVYTFYGKNDLILYIGKSVNIHDRVLSHFSNDYISRTDMKISKEIIRIETVVTNGELEALLLESTMIKQFQPVFNRRLRKSQKMTTFIKELDANGYFRVNIKEIEDFQIEDLEKIVGVFRSLKQAKEFLYQAASDYKLCPKLLNLEKTKDYCFSYQLEKCKGACRGEELNIKYNLRFDEAFYNRKIRPWKFDGPIVLKESERSTEGFVIDKWCLLGKIKSDEDLDDFTYDYKFDLDTYKIIKTFLTKKDHALSIRTFNYPNKQIEKTLNFL